MHGVDVKHLNGIKIMHINNSSLYGRIGREREMF